MMIFIRKLPRGTSKRELQNFIADGLKPKFGLPFGVQGELHKCDILVIIDKDTGSVERHGLAMVLPEKAAEKLIHKLNRTRIRGRLVEVREYVHRSTRTDRRGEESGDRKQGQEQRGPDRRRPHLEIENELNPGIVGLKGFNRIYRGN